MSFVRSAVSRITGRDIRILRSELDEVRRDLQRVADEVGDVRRVVLELNHDVRSGAPEGLPLFLGYAERLRLDAETVLGASSVIDRQLQRLEQRLSELVDRPGDRTDR